MPFPLIYYEKIEAEYFPGSPGVPMCFIDISRGPKFFIIATPAGPICFIDISGSVNEAYRVRGGINEAHRAPGDVNKAHRAPLRLPLLVTKFLFRIFDRYEIHIQAFGESFMGIFIIIRCPSSEFQDFKIPKPQKSQSRILSRQIKIRKVRYTVLQQFQIFG